LHNKEKCIGFERLLHNKWAMIYFEIIEYLFRLAQRLMQVAVQERLKTDLGTLLLLCDKTGNDIRSCLSFLHFFRDRSRQIGLIDVQKASVGQKDTHKGLFAVWHDIFQISRKKQK
jgi:chromosome transmission fidelity protein 18